MKKNDCGEIKAQNAELRYAPMLNLIVASVRGGVRVTRDAKSRLTTIFIAALIG